MESTSRNVTFAEIQTEFSETFGYIRQDIAEIRKADLGLNYTMVLLICCACEMLAWHRDLDDDQVFTSLLPDDETHRVLGKSISAALRNGLAHRFRPHTFKIDKEYWRFQILWRGGPLTSITERKRTKEPGKDNPNWLCLSAQLLQERITDLIDDYERELQVSASARINFRKQAEKSIINLSGAEKIAGALKSLADRPAW